MTRSKSETTTIQTWPGGASFEYRGDIDGPANKRSLRQGHYQSRLHCPENCRKFHLDLLSEADRAKFIGAPNVYAGLTLFPKVGKYITPAEGDDWTTGPICPTCKGEGFIPNPKRNPWRKGTADEWRQILRSHRAAMYAERDIYACDSSLVDDLIKCANGEHMHVKDLSDAFSYDEIRNIYADPSDWSMEQCREYISDHGLDAPDSDPWTMDRETAIETLTAVSIDVSDDESLDTLREAIIVNMDDETISGIDEWRDACRDHAQENPAEVYEWWRVSSWLCDQLHQIGEVTIDNGYGHWWGRTCTGQGYLMDGTLQRVADLFIKSEGL